jgi:hypothetical protein
VIVHVPLDGEANPWRDIGNRSAGPEFFMVFRSSHFPVQQQDETEA